MSSTEPSDKKDDDKVQSEGEVFRASFSTTLGELCPPINSALSIFGNDKLLWMIILVAMHLGYYLVAPACLIFLLPYPVVYVFPMYSSLVALQTPLEPMLRSLWLSYWIIIILVDISEMVLLGTLVQTLQYWPALKIILSLWLICQTPDYDTPGKIDEQLKKKLEEEFRIKRKVMEVDGSSQAKIDQYKSERRAEIKAEVDKSRVREKRYHAFMLVEPFLPSKTHAGGHDISFEQKKKKRSSQWPATAEEWKEFDEERLEHYIKKGIDGQRAGKNRLGDWGRPVVEIDGEVVDHNPVVDDHGRLLDEYKHGKAGEVEYTNTWNRDPTLEGTETPGYAELPQGRATGRDKDGKRIKFVNTTDWMPLDASNRETKKQPAWAGNHGHNQPYLETLQAKIDQGIWRENFAGNSIIGTDDRPDKVLGLNSSAMPLHPTATLPAGSTLRNRYVDAADAYQDEEEY